MLWKPLAYEASLRKWPSWSGHLWVGALISRALPCHAGWALVSSCAGAVAWELAWWVLSRRAPEDRPGAIDAAAWVLGAAMGTLLRAAWPT